jgi:hypothetical protein
MIVGHIAGCTRVIGKSQGYIGLPLRDEPYHDTASDQIVSSMVSAWTPTPDELERLNKGAPLYLRVMGKAHPPVILNVGDPPK